tara:strand:+ start:436 stop:549 length:114 start_codon:yes stop_codon:yes gene_type:complete
MIILSELPKIHISLAAVIPIEIAGLIENKYTHFYRFF